MFCNLHDRNPTLEGLISIMCKLHNIPCAQVHAQQSMENEKPAAKQQLHLACELLGLLSLTH
jgi:hypothetical protein